MRKLVITMLMASLIIVLAAANVSANRISTSHTDIRWETDVHIRSGTGTIVCRATLVGTFHGTSFSKANGSLVGHITNATYAEPCTARGEDLPWHLTYDSFDGTLPNISVLWFLLVDSSVTYHDEDLGVTCEFTTTSQEPGGIGAIIEGGRSSTMAFDSSREIGLSGGFFCDLLGNVTLGGEGEYESGEGDTNVFTLI